MPILAARPLWFTAAFPVCSTSYWISVCPCCLVLTDWRYVCLNRRYGTTYRERAEQCGVDVDDCFKRGQWRFVGLENKGSTSYFGGNCSKYRMIWYNPVTMFSVPETAHDRILIQHYLKERKRCPNELSIN